MPLREVRLDIGLNEKRASPRWRVSLPCAAGGAPDGMPIIVHEISATGLLLETGCALSSKDLISVELPEYIARAEVVWRSGARYGCRFIRSLPAGVVSAVRLKGGFVLSRLVLPAVAAEPLAPIAGDEVQHGLSRLSRLFIIIALALACWAPVAATVGWLLLR